MGPATPENLVKFQGTGEVAQPQGFQAPCLAVCQRRRLKLQGYTAEALPRRHPTLHRMPHITCNRIFLSTVSQRKLPLLHRNQAEVVSGERQKAGGS